MTFNSRLIATLLVCGGAAFNASAASYYNVSAPMMQLQGTLYLSQDENPCTPGASWTLKTGGLYQMATCMGSVEASPENLKTLLSEQWVNSSTGSTELTLATNIDLGEISETEGECNANHEPLPFPGQGTFNGNGFTISNLCYVSETMSQPVGFFESAKSGLISGFSLDGVRILIKGTSTDGADYYPVGSVIGVLDSASVSGATVSNVSIDAPIAGGVAGLVVNSTLSKVEVFKNVLVKNSHKIETGYAGSQSKVLNAPYSVFLGGIAGVSIRDNGTKDYTLVDNQVTATVWNNAQGISSAVGGAVGYVASSLDHFKNVKVTSGTLKDNGSSLIYGGSAMGGLFGYVSLSYLNGSPVTSDTSVTRVEGCSFNGVLGMASSPDVFAVGGLIGRDSLWARSRLEIVSSSAEVSINEQLNTAGTYRYYAGGLLGYGNDCQSSERLEDFIAIEKSKSVGIISLTASDKAVEDLHVTTFLGGIAGAACFAMDGSGFKDDTSSVNIVSNVRTTGDSLSIGGMVGSMNAAGKAGISLDNLAYTGRISVQDSLSEVYVGGIVGQFREAYGGKTINFKDVYISKNGSSEAFIDYAALASAKPAEGKIKGTRLGGLCGYCKEIGVAEKVGIFGGITVEAPSKYAGDSLFVGGMVARFENTSAKLTLQKSYMVGDIVVNATAPTLKVGYLMGFGVAGNNAGYSFRSNYHFSENDDVDAFGYISETDAYAPGVTDTWKDNPNMTYIIRNGETSTYKENTYKNGTELASEMQKRDFAAVMNDVIEGTAEDPNVWCYGSGLNGGLPYVTSAINALPITNDVTYMVNFFDDDRTTLIVAVNVVEGKAAVRPKVEKPEGKTFVEWSVPNEELDAVYSDMNVYAVYKVDSFKVIFYDREDLENAGYIVAYDGNTRVPYNETVRGPDTADYHKSIYAQIPEGYKFCGWSDSSFATGVKSDLRIYPKQCKETYKVSVLDAAGEVAEVKPVLFDDPLPSFGNAVKESSKEFSYQFEKWVLAEDDSDLPAKMPASNIAVKPLFKSVKNVYDVVFLDCDGSLLDRQQVEYGSSAKFPAYTPKSEDWRFVGWSDSNIVNIDTAKTIVAKARVKVLFKVSEDSVYHEEWISYGYDLSSINERTLSRDTLNGYEYAFNRWDTDMGIVNGPMVITAIYDSTRYTPVPSDSSSGSVPTDTSTSGGYFVADKLIDTVKVDTAGNAVRLVLATKNVYPALKTSAYVVVTGANGYFLEEVLCDSLTAKTGEYVWEKHPLPVGELRVEVFVSNDSVTDVDTTLLNVASSIDVKPWSWRMVSLAKVRQDKIRWGVDGESYWWDERNPIGDYWQYKIFDGGDVDDLRGYWFGSMDGTSLSLKDGTAAKDSLMEWTLDNRFSGWNMVSNPYGWYIALDTAAAARKGIYFWRWVEEESQYKLTDVVGPYESVWAQTEKSATWSVSVAPSFKKYGETAVTANQKVAALRKGAARKASAENWSLVAVLKGENGKEDSWNVLGVGSRAETMEKAPQGMGKFVRLAIMEGSKKLAKSVKVQSDEYEWTLKLSASENSDGELSLEGVDALNQMGFAVYVTVDGKTREVNGATPLKVALTKNSKEAKVRVVHSAKEIASGMSGFKAIQAVGGLQVDFDAPQSLAGAVASYAVVDVKGKVVASGAIKAAAGSNSLNIATPKRGVYFVQLKLGSQNASAKVLVK